MEKTRLAIIDVSGQIESFSATVRTFMRKIKTTDDEGLQDDFKNVASGCERLFHALEKSNPEKLADKDLFSLWESLFCMDQIRKFPVGGTLKNLEMLKIVSTDRIRAFFAGRQLYTIGVDERVAGKNDGTATMVLDLILEDDGSDKLKKADLPRAYISIHRENGGIFVTIDASDVPKLLATEAKKDELIAERKSTRRNVRDAMSKMN